MGYQETVALCDPEAFYPFASLLNGTLSERSEISLIEPFLRAVVLHDEITMDSQPFAYCPESHDEPWTPEEAEAGSRNVIVAIGPDVSKYDLFSDEFSNTPDQNILLSPEQLKLAASFSNAGEGNVYYEAHVSFIRRLLGVVREGGSIVCEAPLAKSLVGQATELPLNLFDKLDETWGELATTVHRGDSGLTVPPVLSVILSRCARRDAILRVVKDLRDEWAQPRKKVWQAVKALEKATVGEANDIKGELKEASKQFVPALGQATSPLRVFWSIGIAGIGGTVLATVSGGNPIVGGLSAAAGQGLVQVTEEIGDVRKFFKRGAFDLARRVSGEIGKIQPVPELLSRFLTEREKSSLGY